MQGALICNYCPVNEQCLMCAFLASLKSVFCSWEGILVHGNYCASQPEVFPKRGTSFFPCLHSVFLTHSLVTCDLGMVLTTEETRDQTCFVGL